MPNIITGTLCAKEGTNATLFSKTFLTEFDIALDKNFEWCIGIDQSTSCTGLTLYPVEGPYFILLDVYRDKCLDSFHYYVELKALLKRLVSGLNVSTLVYERPIPNAKFRTAQNVLYELKGRLEEWMREIPELNNTHIESLLPQTWKSYVVQKSHSNKKNMSKSMIALDIVTEYPSLQLYYENYPFTDFDSFDSFGILLGYFRAAFNEDGYPQIHGYLEKRHNTIAIYQPFTEDEDFLQKLFDTLGAMSTMPSIQSSTFAMCNRRYSWMQNVRIATSTNDCLITLVPDKEVENLHWKFDFPENTHLTAMLFKASSVSRSDMNILEQLFPMNEVIYGE